MSKRWWKSVDRWTEDSQRRMPERMWPRYKWGPGWIVSFHAFWGLFGLWSWWRLDGWPYRWLCMPFLMLILLSGWWRWRLDVADRGERPNTEDRTRR